MEQYLDRVHLLSDHPLNRGCAGCWEVLPGRKGGARWYNLAYPSSRNVGTLTNLTLENAWLSDTVQSGCGSMMTDAVDGYVECGVIAGLAGSADAIISGWMYRSSNSVPVGFGCYPVNSQFSLNWYSDARLY